MAGRTTRMMNAGVTGPDRNATRSGPRRSRPEHRLLIALIAAAVVTVAAITVVAVQTAGTTHRAASPPSSAAATLSSAPSTSAAPSFELGYQPLYPFADLTAAQGWQSIYRSQGVDPWHLDAGQTALAFTQQFLGFTEIDRVTTVNSDSIGAHIGVGSATPNATLFTAAVLHLVRYGTESDSPWEVVGSDDTTFSLDTPDYGARVSSPITAGGRITGVDDSISITVRRLDASAAVGQSCCTPAGGDNQPWAATVPYTPSSGAVLAIVAATGGHVQQVERFAITAAIG
jgi:hypothetical protein